MEFIVAQRCLCSLKSNYSAESSLKCRKDTRVSVAPFPPLSVCLLCENIECPVTSVASTQAVTCILIRVSQELPDPGSQLKMDFPKKRRIINLISRQVDYRRVTGLEPNFEFEFECKLFRVRRNLSCETAGSWQPLI